MRAVAVLVVMLVSPLAARAADSPLLARARVLYNMADYDGAIAAAAMARTQAGTADAAALVEARAHLERFRQFADPADLTAARESLSAIHASALSPRDAVDLLIGLGQSLYVTDRFGAAAELFETALGRADLLSAHDRLMLLDWWATAVDRDAQATTPERRARLFGQIAARMEEELRRDPGSAPANYWLAVAGRGTGDLDAAWQAAIAGWVRAALNESTSQALRGDIDRLVTEALIPERVYARPVPEQADAAETLRSQWEAIKQEWK